MADERENGENRQSMTGNDDISRWLDWLVHMGVDEAISETPVDRFAQSQQRANLTSQALRADLGAAAPSTAAPSTATPGAATPSNTVPSTAGRAHLPPPPRNAAVAIDPNKSSDQLISDARGVAAGCQSVEDIAAALLAFDACPLKRTATNLCLYDGKPSAEIMLIGEAPGREEDLQGKPFVGRSGQLLDKMLALIGLSREGQGDDSAVFITNTVFWRPPGNRKPTLSEAEMCMPFVERLIEVIAPKVIVCFGATPTQRLLGTGEGILKLRGKWRSYAGQHNKTPLLATLHPAYLLRQPAQKRLAWRDLLTLSEALEKNTLT